MGGREGGRSGKRRRKEEEERAERREDKRRERKEDMSISGVSSCFIGLGPRPLSSFILVYIPKDP